MRRPAVLLAVPAIVAIGGVSAVALANEARLTSPPVAPITVRVGKPFRECDAHGENCSPWFYRPFTVSFVARASLSPGVSWYELTTRFTPTGSCFVEQGGEGGPAGPQHLRAGRRATFSDDIPDCPRIVHGAIVYDTSTAPHSHQYVPNIGPIDGVLVGTFSFRMS